MSNTYTQIHIHCIFTVQNRHSLITEEWRDELYKYITGIIKNNGHKLLTIGGMPDHIHLLIGLRPTQSLSDLMQSVKGDSSEWINKNNFVSGRFSWQEGYGAFSYSRSQLDNVIKYINSQEQHHTKKSFINEYKEFLQKFDVVFDDRYIFNPVN
jgi:REP element-mobilizing transposase RayT